MIALQTLMLILLAISQVTAGDINRGWSKDLLMKIM
jgi:hypothetical protein